MADIPYNGPAYIADKIQSNPSQPWGLAISGKYFKLYSHFMLIQFDKHFAPLLLYSKLFCIKTAIIYESVRTVHGWMIFTYARYEVHLYMYMQTGRQTHIQMCAHANTYK